MLLKTAIIINGETGAYVTCVAIKTDTPVDYVLGANETIVFDIAPPRSKEHAEHDGFLLPVLQNGVWCESAPAEELTNWCIANPKPVRALHPKIIEGRLKTDTELAIIEQAQQITALELCDIANGQAFTDLELTVLGGK